MVYSSSRQLYVADDRAAGILFPHLEDIISRTDKHDVSQEYPVWEIGCQVKVSGSRHGEVDIVATNIYH